MSSNKLTDAEARQMLEMTKKSLVQEINFPTRGNEKEFDVVGDTLLGILRRIFLQ